MSEKTYSEEQMLLAFAAGYLSACEGDNGECNEYTDISAIEITPGDLLKIDKARRELVRAFKNRLSEL